MTDTSCGQCRNLLALRITDDLDMEEQVLVDEHVHACPSCQDLLMRLKASTQALQESGAEPLTALADRPSLWTRLEPRLGPPGKRNAGRAPWITTPQLGALALSLALLLLYQEWRPRAPGTIRRLADTQEVEINQLVRPVLGVGVVQLTEQLAEQFHEPVTTGVIVVEVLQGSAAERAGLRTGDVIFALAGEPIQTSAQLREHVQQLHAGDLVELVIIRNGRPFQRRLVIGAPSSQDEGHNFLLPVPQPRSNKDDRQHTA